MPRQPSSATEQRIQRFCRVAVRRTLLWSSVSRALATGCRETPERHAPEPPLPVTSEPANDPLLPSTRPTIVSRASYAPFPCANRAMTPEQEARLTDRAKWAQQERRERHELDRRARGLHLREELDFIEVVSASGPSSVTVLGSDLQMYPQPLVRAGSLCRGSRDVTACHAEVARKRDALFQDVLCVNDVCPTFSFVYALTTHGDRVQTYRGREQLLSLLAPIDTPVEAWLLVSTGGEPLPLICATPDVGQHRVSTKGHFIKSRQWTSRCEPLLQEELEYLVSSAGVVKLVSRRDISRQDDACVVSGRRPAGLQLNITHDSDSVGELLARITQLESASVIAFEQLAEELRELGADEELLARVRQASQDERRHAALMDAWAEHHGGRPGVTSMPPRRARSLLELAIENAEEGCVRELFGALVVRFQATRASEARLREELDGVADDEASHAALSHDVDRWLCARLSREERARVVEAKRTALHTLAASLREPSVEQRSILGMPSLDESRHLLEQMHS